MNAREGSPGGKGAIIASYEHLKSSAHFRLSLHRDLQEPFGYLGLCRGFSIGSEKISADLSRLVRNGLQYTIGPTTWAHAFGWNNEYFRCIIYFTIEIEMKSNSASAQFLFRDRILGAYR
jgi:hypothetical protein